MTDQREDRPVRTIDGAAFDDFEGFAREFSKLLDEYPWRGNLDAFNDILHGGFGTPQTPWVLRWTDAERSRAALGHAETARRLERLERTADPSNRADVRARLAAARRGEGPTLFDTIVEIIRDHEPGIVLELA